MFVRREDSGKTKSPDFGCFLSFHSTSLVRDPTGPPLWHSNRHGVEDPPAAWVVEEKNFFAGPQAQRAHPTEDLGPGSAMEATVIAVFEALVCMVRPSLRLSLGSKQFTSAEKLIFFK